MEPVSKLTTKGQTTIPREVRDALDLRSGDRISYRIEQGSVVIRKLVPVDIAHLRALQVTLSEWNSSEDAEAYDDL
jgi:antitoxin PrlF